MSINKVILVGNVGKDPEVKYLESGTAVARFSLATNESYKNKNGEKVTNTEWHNIEVWRGTAEFVEKYVRKGTQLYVEGKIRTENWEDREGNKRYTTKILVDSLQLLSRKDDNNVESAAPPAIESQENNANNQDEEQADDLPF